MAYYLSMDGVDDKITTPSMTVTEVVMDVTVKTRGSFKKYWSIQGTSDFLQINGSNVEQWSAGVSAVYKNAVAQTNLTNFMTVDTRATLRIVLTSAQTNINYIVNNLGSSGYLHCYIYDVKFYNGATLQAHYDMTLGNVTDQSGNGRNATLTGGTWVDDGGGGSAVAGGGTLTGTGSLTASGINNISGGASFSGNGSLIASGTVTSTGISGAASLQGTGTLTATGINNIPGGASLTGTGSLAMVGSISGGASLTATCTLTATGRDNRMTEWEMRLAMMRVGGRAPTVAELIAMQMRSR